MDIKSSLFKDDDKAQNVIRIFLITIVLVYVLWYGHNNNTETARLMLNVAIGFFLFSVISFVSFWLIDIPVLLRRTINIFADAFVITFSMASFGEPATPFFGGYLWISIAYGIRFGRNYMYISWALSLIGFIYVLFTTPYWQEQITIGVGILAWMILLPLYVSKLLRNLESTVEREKEANMVKSQFLANMSHELRTPLNTVIGYSELLKEDAVEDDNASLGKDLDKINHAAHHLLNLINDVLDLSKIEAGRMDVHVEDVDVRLLVQQIRELIVPQVEKNQNQLSINIDDDCDYIQTDYTKLKQILLNLLSNAAKFTHNGDITLSIRQLNFDKDNVIEVIVTDTGIGIDEDGLERLFEPFTQADTSTTRKYGGTGLGLTITKRFSEMLHGSLSVDSDMGKGTSFQLVLPKEYAATADYKKYKKLATKKRFGESEEYRGAREKISTILSIEDDPDMRDILTRNLTAAGFHVETASNGLDGLKKAREIKPDAITLDVMMPGIDGWSVLKTLKLDPELKYIPVIMVSMTNQLNISKVMGANDYLQKPVDFEKLHNMLRKWLRSDGRTDILIVDDDQDTRAAMKSIIEQKGAQVREAENGKQALDIMKSFSPDVLLVDLLMPGVDSFELLETVHSLPNADAISIIVTTAKDLTKQDKQRLEKMGVYIIQKNQLSSNDLLKTIKDAVGPITLV